MHEHLQLLGYCYVTCMIFQMGLWLQITITGTSSSKNSEVQIKVSLAFYMNVLNMCTILSQGNDLLIHLYVQFSCVLISRTLKKALICILEEVS